MDARSHTLIRKIARTTGLVVFLFIAVLAADSVAEGLGAFFVHLIPSIIVLALVLVAWRWDLLGGLAFIFLACAYGFVARPHVSWILSVSLPLAATGALFVWSGRARNDRGLRMKES
jgi:uncharacterized ion transporter superfamily protein YfcC